MNRTGHLRGSGAGEFAGLAAFVLPVLYAFRAEGTLFWALTITTWVALWVFMSWWSPAVDCGHCGGIQVVGGRGECRWCRGSGEQAKWQVRAWRRFRTRRTDSRSRRASA